ncbi:2-hydroxyacid dehydrogenase [Desulfoferula mesophila]|uniref:D-glycerate dehydrogenase n=1 Tax=Desulfoferula mesophila TaxID=3058419 RepID=A0AAU9EMJ7_9BACT|nr:D-glycerate dehydrogenase [Desulfoferula mesophilus]
MKPKVLVTRGLPEPVMEFLRENFQLSVNPRERAFTREEFLAAARGMEGILPLLTERIDGEALDAAGPGLKIVANYAVGYNNIDLDAATARGVAVSNTPGVLTDTTADLAMALILAVARRVPEGDRLCRTGGFPGWSPQFMLGADVHHKTLGLVGLGRVGRAVARRAAGFDMELIYAPHGACPAGGVDPESGARCLPLAEVLARADFLSLHVPLTPETRHLLGAAELALMKPGAFLINTARGEVVDEAALARALASGRLGGAGLDVYENEPRVHPGLVSLDNVVLLPHVGSATVETRVAMGKKAADNLVALLLRGQRPPDCLNPEVLG